MATRVCILPGQVWVKRNGKFFRSTIDKKHCGTFVRATRISGGDFRLGVDVAEVAVAGKRLFARGSSLKLSRF